MEIPGAASRQYDGQQRIAAVVAASVVRAWSATGDDFDAGWASVRSGTVSTVQLGRAAAIHRAAPYVGDVLRETGQAAAPVGVIVPAAFLASTPDGFAVESAFDSVPIRAKQAVGRGASAAEARAVAGSWLAGTALTMLSDTRRDIYQAGIISRPKVTGYTRMVHPGACSRCIILAGKWFRWNKGFARHKNCYCTHIPAAENVAGDFTTDPYEHFKSLSEAEQDRVFGKVQAQGIRDGADIYRVVNSKTAGLRTVGGTTKYGKPKRQTLADIYAHDRNRQHVVSNLTHHGWITGPQRAGGNIVGNLNTDAAILARGPGVGTYKVGGQVVETNRSKVYRAVESGARDPLERATMTAAERRLFDAHYRAGWAQAGYRPNSVGANSADRGLGLRPISAAEAARVEADYVAALNRARNDQYSPDLQRLIALLGN